MGLGWTIEGYFLPPVSTSICAQQGFLGSVCLHLNVSLSLSLGVSPSPPQAVPRCLAHPGCSAAPACLLPTWHAATTCLQRLEKSTRQQEAQVPLGRGGGRRRSGHAERGAALGSRPWGQTKTAGVCVCAQVGVSSCGPGLAGNTSSSHMPRAIPAPGHSSGGPLLPHPCHCQLLQGTPGAVPT